MITGSTLFPHRDVHKVTCKSPYRDTCNQIDCFLTDSRHKSALTGVTSYSGTDMDSDHNLCVSHLETHICNIKKKERNSLSGFGTKDGME